MGERYVRVMDWLYWFCIAVGVFSVIAMTGLIGTGVFLPGLGRKALLRGLSSKPGQPKIGH